MKPGTVFCLCKDQTQAVGGGTGSDAAYCPKCNTVMLDFRFEPVPHSCEVIETVERLIHELTHWVLYRLEGREACEGFDELVLNPQEN